MKDLQEVRSKLKPRVEAPGEALRLAAEALRRILNGGRSFFDVGNIALGLCLGKGEGWMEIASSGR